MSVDRGAGRVGMKISKIDVFQLDLPYSGGVYRLSHGRTYTSFDATLVRITAEDGTEGWGESTPFGGTYIAAHALGVRAGIEEVAPHLLGMDPRLTERIGDAMNRHLLGHAHAKTPIDVACWDLFGKSVGMPVCDLLGGRIDQRLPIISSIHTGEPEDMRARVADHRARGFMGHSVKVGALDSEGGPALDVARIEACVADRRPAEFFLADANGGLTPETALRMLRLLPDDVDIVLEAPCATWRESVSLRQRTSVPIHLDELVISEEDLIRMIADDAADGIGFKVSKNGGLTAGRRHRDICVAAGLTMSVQDTVGSEVAYAAVLHLGQTVPEPNLRCVINTCEMVGVQVADFDVPVRDGGVVAPDLPGLGVEPNLDVLGEPVATWG